MAGFRRTYLWGWRLFGGFLILSAAMLLLASLSLVFTNGPLESIWTGQSEKRQQLAALGWPLIVGFMALSVVFAVNAYGWYRHRRWAWVLAVTLISANLAGDVAQATSGHLLEGIMGISIGSAVLAFLWCTPVREIMSAGQPH